jgi:hypothetical protein
MHPATMKAVKTPKDFSDGGMGLLTSESAHRVDARCSLRRKPGGQDAGENQAGCDRR